MRTRLIRTVAVLVCLVLGQTLAAALLHTMLVDHIWCETHQDFEHLSKGVAPTPERISFDDFSAGDSSADDAHADARHLSDKTPAEPLHPGEDKRTPDHLCFYLTSMHGPAIPLPSIQEALLNLPPPAELPSTPQFPGDATTLPRQIDTLHQSPGLSPPQRMA